MTTTSIGIADNKLLARAGIKHLLQELPAYSLLFEVVNETELWTQLEKQRPTVLVIDYDQSPHFKMTTVLNIIRQYPDVQLLIISDDDCQRSIIQLLESGVKGFITKACSEEEVRNALAAVQQREKFFCGKVLDYLVEWSRAETDHADLSLLSPREIEIVSLIAKGMVAKEIGEQLHLSRHTVYTHRKNILKKLGLKSSSELLVFALENNLTL